MRRERFFRVCFCFSGLAEKEAVLCGMQRLKGLCNQKATLGGGAHEGKCVGVFGD